MAIIFAGANDFIGAVSRLGAVAFVHGLRYDESYFPRQAPDPIPSRAVQLTPASRNAAKNFPILADFGLTRSTRCPRSGQARIEQDFTRSEILFDPFDSLQSLRACSV